MYIYSLDTTSPDANMDDIKIDASSKKPPKRKKRKTLRRNMREKNLVYLTQLEKEMIDWALNSFQPFGPSNFQPTESMRTIYILLGACTSERMLKIESVLCLKHSSYAYTDKLHTWTHLVFS